MAKLDATGQRWVASLCDYDLVIKYRSGRKNADSLSCVPSPEKEEKIILPEVLRALSFSLKVENCPLVESVAISDTPETVPPLVQPEISEQQLNAHDLTYTIFEVNHGSARAGSRRTRQEGSRFHN